MAAFESFLTQDAAKPKKWRRVTFTISLALHGALLIAGAIYSFWHVEELSPPSVTVTFLTAAPPPPPPPPPPKKKKTTPTKRPTEIIQPKPSQIVQPKEQKEPEPEEEDEGVEGGVEGGVAGGVVGGLVGNDAPKMLAPNIGTGQLAIDPQSAEYKVRMPAALNRPGNTIWGLFKICVTEGGVVKNVTVIKGADPLADAEWMAKIRTWKYRPYSINGRPVPYCYPLRLTLSSQL
jgi:periplasmic protein TonB